MKQEIFKSMYNKIVLTEEQKDGIYKELEEASEEENAAKKVRFTARAAAFAVLFLLSGMTVFAVGRLSMEDRFAEAMHPRHEHNLMPEQKGFYEQYGKVLDNVIETYYGTLKFEAALYDDYYLIVPYSYDLDTEDGNREEWSGIAINGLVFVPKTNLDYIGNPSLSHYTYRNAMGDDGIVTGSYIFLPNDDETFEPGEVIQVYTQGRDSWSVDKFLTEFTLGDKVDRVNLTIDEPARKALEEKGMMIEEMSVSPISIFYSGISVGYIYQASVVLKDGSVIECYSGYSGSGERKDGKLKEEYPYEVHYSRLFTTPINLDEVEGVQINTGKTDILITIEYDD